MKRPRRKSHSQKEHPFYKVCPSCKMKNCEECVDSYRILYTDERICTCKRSGHLVDISAGELKRNLSRLSPGNEAHTQQIMDPVSGVIHAPGLTVSPDGEVKFRDEEK